MLAAEAAGAPKEEIVPMILGAKNALGTDAGELDQAFVWAGQCVGLIEQVEPADAILRRMVEEARARLSALKEMF